MRPVLGLGHLDLGLGVLGHFGPVVLEALLPFGLVVVGGGLHLLLEPKGVLGLGLLDADVIVILVGVILAPACLLLLAALLQVSAAEHDDNHHDEEEEQAADDDQGQVALRKRIVRDVDDEGLVRVSAHDVVGDHHDREGRGVLVRVTRHGQGDVLEG